MLQVKMFMRVLVLSLMLSSISIAAYAKNKIDVSQTISDTAITAAVKLKFASNPILNPIEIAVSTKEGVVSLSGDLDADSQYETAITLAECVDGVKDTDVENLHVKKSQNLLTDLAITAKIKAKLIREKLISNEEFPSWGIHIETNNNIVYLTGAANSMQEKENLIRIAKSIKNVKSVKDDIKMNP